MTPLDTQARKQLLLTRIALERAEWVHDVDALRRRLTPSDILAALLHRAGRGGLAGALFGQHTPAGAPAAGWAGRLMAAVLMVRRHPLWWPVLAGAWTWIRQRRVAPVRARPMRTLALGTVALAATAVAGWWLLRGRRRGDDATG